MRVVIYIHRNPQHHNFMNDFREWPYSSYQAIVSDQPTQVLRENVLEWFNNVKDFKHLHERDSVVELDDLE